MLFRKSRSSEAFEREAERVFSSVYGTALRLTRSRDEAEDLTQEAMVRAYEAFDRFDGTNFKAWILRIVTNLYINRYRQRQRSPVVGSIDEEGVYEPVSDSATPDEELFGSMLGAEVEEALAKVPEAFRIAVILSDIEQMSYEEIAAATDVPIGTVRSRIARGRAVLRKNLEEFAVEHGYVRQGKLEEDGLD